jgi:hypothetical protein
MSAARLSRFCGHPNDGMASKRVCASIPLHHAKVVEECREISIARVQLIPDTLHTVRIYPARTRSRLTASGWSEHTDGGPSLQRIIEPLKQALACKRAREARSHELGELAGAPCHSSPWRTQSIPGSYARDDLSSIALGGHLCQARPKGGGSGSGCECPQATSRHASGRAC